MYINTELKSRDGKSFVFLTSEFLETFLHNIVSTKSP